jgi:hypothetical protein
MKTLDPTFRTSKTLQHVVQANCDENYTKNGTKTKFKQVSSIY